MVQEKLDQIIKDVLKCDVPAEIVANQTQSWDSLTHLNLILALEEGFEIEVPPEQIGKLYRDYNTIFRFIEDKIGNGR